MDSSCTHCRHLMESQILSEPHRLLDKVSTKLDSQLYQCRLCLTCFEFTKADIYLVGTVSSLKGRTGVHKDCA